MVNVEKLDTKQKAQRRRFSHIPFQFYTQTPQWVPPILIDVEGALDREKHPFYEHSNADFFVAIRDGRDPERITHVMADILRGRIFAIACGYEDGNDLDRLRTDPAFKLACGRLPDTSPPRCTSAGVTSGRVSLARYPHGSHKRTPRKTTSPT